MKLLFIVPGDQIRLLEDGGLDNSQKGMYGAFNGMKIVPAGSLLQVSQVYIRNAGWFASSLTFKVKEGPLLNLMYESSLKFAKQGFENMIKQYQDRLDEFIKHDADVQVWTRSFMRNFIYQKEDPIWVKGEFTQAELERKYPTLSSWSRKSDVLKSIEYYQNQLKNPKPERNYKSQVIRVVLKDVESWDVEIIRKV